MLVLTRKAGESIVVGDNIQITIVEVVGNRIRIGINAPREVPIVRAEVEEVQFELPGESGDHDTQIRPKTKTNI
jgi:carbon storage regulator